MNWQTVLTAMLPEHLLLAGIVLLMSVELVTRNSRAALALSLLSVAAAALAAFVLYANGVVAAPFAGQFSVDPGTSLAKAVVLALALPVLLMSRAEFSDSRFHILLLTSLYGACLLPSSDTYLTLFLGIELLSLPVYVLVLLAYARPQSAEAALKYLVLSGTASATFLMGVSLLYGATGSMSIATFAAALGAGDTLSTLAVVLILAAFFLKAAIVPFHAWAPDAYEASSVTVTGFMSTIVKAAVLLAVLRLFGEAKIERPLLDLLVLLPLVSIVWGNLAAMRQASLRRLIAYSSIAHAGYLFFAFLGEGPTRYEAVIFYVIAYGLMNLVAFAALPTNADDAARDRLDGLQGLFQRSPASAVLIAIAMLSLAGIPPLPGFVAKFLIFKNVIEAGYTLYAVAGLVGSYLGIYFYLRVIQLMFMNAEQPAAGEAGARRLAFGAAALCLAPAILIAVFPGALIGRL